MAMRLGKLCGDGPEIWLAMQTKRDLWDAKRSVDVSAIPNPLGGVDTPPNCGAHKGEGRETLRSHMTAAAKNR